MSTTQLRTYRFKTAAQWNACLFAQADRSGESSSAVVRPFARYENSPQRFGSPGARNPFFKRAGEVLWIDDQGVLDRLPVCNDTPDMTKAPCAIVRASRIVTTPDGIWVMAGKPTDEPELYQADSLELYDPGSYTRLTEIGLSNFRLVDIAGDGDRSFFALIEEKGKWSAISFDRRGRITLRIEFEDLSDAFALTFLKRSRRFVIATHGTYLRLEWFSIKDLSAECQPLRRGRATRLFTRPMTAMRPCFDGKLLGGDSQERVFLAGDDPARFGGAQHILTFDLDGNSIGDITVDRSDAPITGLTGYRGSLLATGKRGLLRYGVSETVPDGAGPVRCTVITPMLFSPDREDKRRWLRVQATASLPEGSTLEIAYASADSVDDQKSILALVNDTSLPASLRVESFLSETDLWKGRTVFRGSGTSPSDPKTFSAKLFDERDRYIWISVSLSATNGAQLPALSGLDVLYPGRTLVENLPEIYQADETKPDSFLRSFVGVLETTTQDIDDRVASMGSLINPATAAEPWLDFVARWVGVPWDDELSLEQKRSLLGRAPDISKDRGTRRSLEALLESLFPGDPRRFRVTDTTADFGFALVGGGSCRGSMLPALLGAGSKWSPELNLSAVLGRVRLPCSGRLDDPLAQLAGKIRVDVAVTEAERKSSEPWLLDLINEMVPMTARVELYWVTRESLRTNRLDGTMVLRRRPTPHLGTDAITSLARLPARELRISDTDPILNRRLR